MANKDNNCTTDNLVTELDIDDKEQSEREYIEFTTATIMTICNDFVSRRPRINLCSSQSLTELLKDVRRKYKTDIDNIKELNMLWDIYAVIRCTRRIKPTLMRYCIMIGIHPDIMNSWNRGEYSGRVASGHSESAQKWRVECESSLYDEVIQIDNIGYMSALKADYGYRDNIQITQTDGKTSPSAYSREEIAARVKAIESLPGSVEDLSD